jgi:hypothetical protein
MALEVDQTEKVFREMLAEADIVFSSQNKWGFWLTDTPSPQGVWRVFKEFAKLKVNVGDNENDALLFQWGKSRELETRIEYFYLDFTRQFSLHNAEGEYDHAEGEYDHMEQLNCTLKYEINNELDIPSGNFWSYQFDNSFELFFSAVEETEQFHLGTQYQPFRLEMCQGQV